MCKISLVFQIIISSRKEVYRTTNGENGPVAEQIYEIWNCTVFIIWEFRRKSKLCIYQTFLINNWFAWITYIYSDLAKNCHFCVPIIVNISISPPLDPKVLICKESSANALNVYGYVNWIRGSGVCKSWNNNILKLLISAQNLYFCD